jgi:uncharacterized protein YjdB
MRKKVAVLLAISGLLFGGCGVDMPVEERSTLTLNKTELSLQVGERGYLSAVLENTSVEPYFVWRSSDEKVVEVDDGILFAVGEGIAYVSVQSRENTASCKVVVKK